MWFLGYGKLDDVIMDNNLGGYFGTLIYGILGKIE